MIEIKKLVPAIFASSLLAGCGIGTTALPEIWDEATDRQASYHMETQVKVAVLCALKNAVQDVRALEAPNLEYNGRIIRSQDQYWLPDDWGILVQLSIQADEKSSLTPGVTLKSPIDSVITGFRNGPAAAAQAYSTGIGGQLSSQNIRYNKYNFFYTVKDLATPIVRGSICGPFVPETVRRRYFGDRISASSPLVNASGLGIQEWLTSAVRVIQLIPSSNSKSDDSGLPLGSKTGATASDAATYSNKFVIITSANVTPNWNLFKIGTPTTPLFDGSRTRTHELIMTVGPGAIEITKQANGKKIANIVPNNAAAGAQLAAQIGSAVGSSVNTSLISVLLR